MKFNEKLIELRKKEALSQEELGYKLNVTRQTVSKWELGQTTPEMSKLTQIANLFKVSVDELVNEEDIKHIEDNKNNIGNKEFLNEENYPKNKKKIIKTSLIILIIGLLIGGSLIFVGVIKQNNAKKANEQANVEANNLLQENLTKARERINIIDSEIEKLNNELEKLKEEDYQLSMNDSDWFNKKSRIQDNIQDVNVQIMNLETEKSQLENTTYTVNYDLVPPMQYRIFYYIGAGVIVVACIISVIFYFIATRKGGKVC